MYVELIENINTHKIEFICNIGQILTSIVCIDVLFEIHDISIQYRAIDIYIFHIFKLIIHIITCIYKKLIENINIPILSLHVYIDHILTFRVCIDVLFDISHISFKYRFIKYIYSVCLN